MSESTVVHQMWPPLCRNCNDKDVCQKLCPPAETYVSQDEVKSHDLPLGDSIETFTDEYLLEFYREIDLTPQQEIICTLLDAGVTREEVCNRLKIKRNTLRSHLRFIRIKACKDNSK